MNDSSLQAPFPWFGGKSRIAAKVWEAFGTVDNYVEPFFGSGAVLLGRPFPKPTETVNDKDGFISNFWRAIKHAPDEVTKWADNPVNENDLHARHFWLVSQTESLVRRLEGDPEWFDAKIAGWWVWGICAWIGGGFCRGDGPWRSINGELVRLDSTAEGLGVIRKVLQLGWGSYINRKTLVSLDVWFSMLSSRLRHVRVCSGDWSRVCSPSSTYKGGTTGVFLDPPYPESTNRALVYRVDDLSIATEVRDWAIEAGKRSDMRIALCSYAGTFDMPSDWYELAWLPQPDNRKKLPENRERVWFSPACRRKQGLFGLFSP